MNFQMKSMNAVVVAAFCAVSLTMTACGSSKSGGDAGLPTPAKEGPAQPAQPPETNPTHKIGGLNAQGDADNFSCHVLPKSETAADKTTYCVELPKKNFEATKGNAQAECKKRVEDSGELVTGWWDEGCPRNLKSYVGYCVSKLAPLIKTRFYDTGEAEAREKCLKQDPSNNVFYKAD